MHLLQQSSIHCLNGQLIPYFIGHPETMHEDCVNLQQDRRRERLLNLGRLPEKNVRRTSDHRDVPRYFQDPNFVRLVSERYSNDLNIFYGNCSNEQLIEGDI